MTIYTPQCEQKRLNVNDRRVGIKMSWGGARGGGGWDNYLELESNHVIKKVICTIFNVYLFDFFHLYDQLIVISMTEPSLTTVFYHDTCICSK